MMHDAPRPGPRRFLFLQGPITPFFHRVAAELRRLGHATFRINLNWGDRLFWRGPGASDYRGRAADWPAFITAFLQREAITDLVLLGEQRPYHRAAITAAKALGITVTVTDFGYLRPDWIVLERDGMGAESRLPRDPAAIRTLAEGLPPVSTDIRFHDSFLTQAIWDMAWHLAALLPFGFPHYQRWTLHHPVASYLATGLQLLRRRALTRAATARVAALQQQPRFVFAMQMENDFSIRAYSHYPDNDTAIAETLSSFARAAPGDAVLLFKLHPLDPGLKHWRGRIMARAAAAGLAARVQVLEGAMPGDDAMRGARGLVTINSTMGLRALILGLPVCCLGQSIYDIAGLTWQDGLDGFWTQATTPDPLLVEALQRVIAHCLQVRGVYYAEPGLTTAVAETVQRLHQDIVNTPITAPPASG